MMKNHIAENRICSTAVFFLLLSIQLISCGDQAQTFPQTPENEEQSAETTAAETQSAVNDPLAEFADTDFGGKTFRVMGRVNESYGASYNSIEIYAEEENGELLNDAVFRRNFAITERFNVTFSQTLCQNGRELSTLTKLCSSGEDLYDLVFLPLQDIGKAAKDGYFYDLYTVEGINFSKPYWNQNVNEILTIGNKLYFTSSDFSLLDKARTNFLVYNNDMAETFDIPDIVDTVRAGKWTVENLKEYCRITASDLNGDGKMDENDRFGLGMDSMNAFNAFVFGCNNAYVKNNDNSLEIVTDTQHIADTVDRLIPLLCDKNISFFCEYFNNYSAVSQMFYSEKSLFRIAQPISLSGLSANCYFNYTVIPIPKFDEEQSNYLTVPDKDSMLFGIPQTTQTTDFSGFVLEVLSAASTETSLKAYYEFCCKVKYINNEDSAEMLDLIFDGITYDLSTIYNIGLTELMSNIAQSGNNTFSSNFAKKQSSAQKAIDKLTAAFDEIQN